MATKTRSVDTPVKVYRPSFLDTTGDLRPSVERELVSVSNAIQTQMPKINAASDRVTGILDTPLGDQTIRQIMSTYVFQTDAVGEAVIPFPLPFKEGTIPFPVVVCNGDGGAGSTYFFTIHGNMTNEHFTVRINMAGGIPPVGSNLRVNYMAMGYV